MNTGLEPPVESFLSGKLSNVDVRKIESELNKLWGQAAGASDEEHPQVIRACSGNLILYSDRLDAESTDADMLDEIILSHPSRAILAISRKTGKDKLEAWVSARCHLASGSGSKQICSELITVLADGDLDRELLSVIDSLLLGDLPTFLWWTISDLGGERIGPYLSSIQRLIVDSARAPYSFEFLRQLHNLVDSTEGCMVISDLSWRRLLGMRSAVAEEFERAPFSINALYEISKVKISSCAQEFQEDKVSTQALYFASWLAAQLEWEAERFSTDKNNKTAAVFKNKQEQNIEIEFASQVLERVAPGSVYELEIELTNQNKLSVSRDPMGEAGSLVVSVYEKGRKIRELMADDSDMDRVHLLGFELEQLPQDEVFRKTIGVLYDLLATLESKP